jgi:tetratricopeptide (TPR) repeat protein
MAEYDVAISFAGEDRALAEQIADFLVNEFRIAVFYDDYEQAKLWGAYLTEKLIEIYRDKARYCAVLVSKDYKIKRYTKLEFRSAQERAFNEPDKEYILPIRLDDTVLDGLFQTLGYVDARKHTPRTIARLIFEKAGDFSRISSIIRLADQKYREGLFDDALALISDPKFDTDIDALRIRGNAFGKKRNYQDAVRAFDMIVDARPNDFLAHFHIGIYSFRLGDFPRSVTHYEIADKLSPNHPTIQTDLPQARRLLANSSRPPSVVAS